jgi:hypothetical protein
MDPQFVTAPALENLPGIRHGFFTRQGGTSSGIYASLNSGLGSADNRTVVLANRELIAQAMGTTDARLATPYQVHSADVSVVDDNWFSLSRPKVDAVVTNMPGIALGIGTADCCPILFADPVARVIGAAHSGWRGARAGVGANTVAAMVNLGAKPDNISVCLGPTISQRNYEVGPEFYAEFEAAEASTTQFFTPAPRAGHFLFNLPGYIVHSLKDLNLAVCDALDICTYEDEQRFYSYRRMTHRKEADYGRQLSAITLDAR